jgi:hypothetical protein
MHADAGQGMRDRHRTLGAAGSRRRPRGHARTGVEECSPVVERRRRRPGVAVEAKRLKPLPPTEYGWVNSVSPSIASTSKTISVIGMPRSSLRVRRARSGKCGSPSSLNATSSPSSTSPGGSSESSRTRAVMFQPRRLLTRRRSSVDTRARNPSHLTSNDQPPPVGRLPVRESIGEAGSGTNRI